MSGYVLRRVPPDNTKLLAIMSGHLEETAKLLEQAPSLEDLAVAAALVAASNRRIVQAFDDVLTKTMDPDAVWEKPRP